MPDTGPTPREIFTDGTLWWKHEQLHRRAMADFHILGPGDPGECFEKLEERFFATAVAGNCHVRLRRRNSCAECWRRAAEATDRWIANLERRNFTIQHEGFAAMWNSFDCAAAMPSEYSAGVTRGASMAAKCK